MSAPTMPVRRGLLGALLALALGVGVIGAAGLDAPPPGAFTVIVITTLTDLGPLNQPTENDGYFKNPKGRMTWVKIHGKRGNRPAQMWEKLYAKHANVAFVFSGHQSRTTAMRVAAQGSLGNFVHSLLSDCTSSGPLRLYRFIPAENNVRVITFDTTKRQLVENTSYVADPAEHHFTVDYAMSKSPHPSVP